MTTRAGRTKKTATSESKSGSTLKNQPVNPSMNLDQSFFFTEFSVTWRGHVRRSEMETSVVYGADLGRRPHHCVPSLISGLRLAFCDRLPIQWNQLWARYQDRHVGMAIRETSTVIKLTHKYWCRINDSIFFLYFYDIYICHSNTHECSIAKMRTLVQPLPSEGGPRVFLSAVPGCFTEFSQVADPGGGWSGGEAALDVFRRARFSSAAGRRGRRSTGRRKYLAARPSRRRRRRPASASRRHRPAACRTCAHPHSAVASRFQLVSNRAGLSQFWIGSLLAISGWLLEIYWKKKFTPRILFFFSQFVFF